MSIANDRIKLLCHTINREANQMPWFDTGPQEFNWAIKAALEASGLPESWIIPASTPEMTCEYQKSFQANGYCLSPNDLRNIVKQI